MFKELDTSLSDREEVNGWAEMVRKWEHDAGNQNPYERTMDGMIISSLPLWGVLTLLQLRLFRKFVKN